MNRGGAVMEEVNISYRIKKIKKNSEELITN